MYGPTDDDMKAIGCLLAIVELVMCGVMFGLGLLAGWLLF